MTAAALIRFGALLAGRRDIERTLADHFEPHGFVEATLAAASDLGVALDAAVVGSALARSGQSPVDDRWPGGDWLPTKIDVETDTVEWTNFGTARLSEPFFEDSTRRARARPFNRLFGRRTSLGDLAGQDRAALRVPDGLIFHMSRCGSTLAAQMLAAASDNIVVSEASPIDEVVQIARAGHITSGQHTALLRAVVGVLGRRRFDERGRYVVKLDSWHSLALPLFRAAFPDTPWVFLYRDPGEVLVSHRRQPGMQTVPGLFDDIYGLRDGHLLRQPEYAARALGAICSAAAVHVGQGGGIAIDYNTLPSAFETRLLPHFGIAPSATQLAQMRESTLVHSKSRQSWSGNDQDEKRNEVDEPVQQLCMVWIDGPIARLRGEGYR